LEQSVPQDRQDPQDRPVKWEWQARPDRKALPDLIAAYKALPDLLDQKDQRGRKGCQGYKARKARPVQRVSLGSQGSMAIPASLHRVIIIIIHTTGVGK
jgi:hypothetical protein